MWIHSSKQNKYTASGLTICALTFLLCANVIAAPDIKSENSIAKKVKTATYKTLRLNIKHTVGGVVPAAQDSDISAQISAIINAFHVDTGHEVKQDDLLVTMNCRENQLRLKQADANLKAEKVQLNHAIKQFGQAKKLNKQGNISKELYNQREAEENRLKATLENRKAARALAQINVDRCQIKAPYDGYITHRSASIGELTQPGTPLLHLVSKTNSVVEVKINNRLLNSFTTGKNFQFIFNKQSYPLRIEFILPVLDINTRNHIARLRFTEDPAATGSVGKVNWQEASASIPADYVVSRDNKLGVLIADGNTARFIVIKDAIEGQAARLALDEETRIITRGRFNIRDGDALQVSNE